MALAQPHIRVQEILVQPVAIGFFLRLQHHPAQTPGGEELFLSVREDLRFKQIAAVNIADDLAGVHELRLQNRQALAVRLRGGIGRVVDDVFIEGGGRLRHGHGIFLVQWAVVIEIHIVEGVAQLVRQRDDVGIGSVKIRQDTALANGLDALTEGAADLPLAREEINPVVVKGLLHHGAQRFIEAAEKTQEQLPRILHRVFPVVFSHGREHVIPRHPVFMPQRLCLAAQIGPELRQVFVYRRKHGVEGFPLHARIVKRPLQGGLIAPQTAVVEHLQLDGVERKGHRIRNFGIALQLRLISLAAGCRIGIIGKIADGGERRCLSAEFHLHGGGQIGLKILPRAGAGKIHPRHDLLFLLLQKIPAVLPDIGQQIAVFRQNRVGSDDCVQVFLLCHKLPEGGLRTDDFRKLPLQAAENGCALRVLRVGSLTEPCIDTQTLGQLLQFLLKLQHGADLRRRRRTAEAGGAFLIAGAKLLQLFPVGKEVLILKACVKRVQRPFVIHRHYFLSCLLPPLCGGFP